MTKTHPPEGQEEFLAELGTLVMLWNRLEEFARLLIRLVYYEHPDKSDILTAHMGTTSLCNTLRTLSSEFATPESHDRIMHYVTYLEIIREYRNYYVHGILGYEEGGGYLQATSARSRYTLHHETITIEHLRTATRRCWRLHEYGGALFEYLEDRLRAKRKKKTLQLQLPDKPPLPERLQKPRIMFRDEQFPPRSSRG